MKERECGKREEMILPWERMMMMGERDGERKGTYEHERMIRWKILIEQKGKS